VKKPGARAKKPVIPPTNRPEPPPQRETLARARVIEAICERISQGTPVRHAAALEGMPKATLYRLMTDDESVGAAVERAQATAAEAWRKDFLVAAGGGMEGANANALLHFGARQWPQEYGETKRLELSGPEGGKLEAAISVTIEQATKAAAGESPEEA
jgi:hypothetical protein